MRCFVVMGGVSRRMGTPKSDLVLDGKTFRKRVFDAATESFDEVIAVLRDGSPPIPDATTIFDDAHEGTSAIHGIARALRHAKRNEKIWIVGIDFPLLTAAALSFLRSEFEMRETDLMVPVWQGEPQMLCAGYSQKLIEQVQKNVAVGKYKLRSLLSGDPAELLPEENIRARFPGEPLLNVNSPEELELLRRAHVRS